MPPVASARSGRRVPIRLVCFDIDGTLALGHGWREVARSRGREKEFDRAQEAFRQGRTDEDTHLMRLLNFARGLPLGRMERVLERTRHVAHLHELTQTLHRRGVTVALLTHNPAYVCRWYAARYGFDLWAGSVQHVRGGRIQGVRRVHVDKVDGLRALLTATGVPARATAHLGDGFADARVFPFVGTAVALNSTLPAVRRAADLRISTKDARRLLPRLRFARRPRPRPLPRDPPLPRGVPGLRVGTPLAS